LSAYCLTIEEGTPFALHVPADLPEEDKQADCYDLMRGILKGNGFSHCEISNFALPGRQCKHNLNYWRGGDYLGLGPAAASHMKGRRLKNEASLDKYLENPLNINAEEEELDIAGKVSEEAMLRLRLLEEGIDISEMALRYGEEKVRQLAEDLTAMFSKGMLLRDGDRYRLPHDKALVSNSILAQVLS
ncbi:MAG: hypothetical protein PHU23_14055, partial [Dehalococcoidales bacterium]|nr:hypothetical protein [Dehalococcoidales bacterium]